MSIHPIKKCFSVIDYVKSRRGFQDDRCKGVSAIRKRMVLRVGRGSSCYDMSPAKAGWGDRGRNRGGNRGGNRTKMRTSSPYGFAASARREPAFAASNACLRSKKILAKGQTRQREKQNENEDGEREKQREKKYLVTGQTSAGTGYEDRGRGRMRGRMRVEGKTEGERICRAGNTG